MPELPEVETICRALKLGGPRGPSILGRRIRGSRLHWSRTVAAPGARAFHAAIRGALIKDLSRRGKFLLVHLNRGTLIFHLRMTGDLIALAPEDAEPRFCRLRIALEDGLRLVFDDSRKFGRVWWTERPEDVLGRLGPEPLDPAFRARDLHDALRARRRQLKPLLLDQTFLAGLGNIYTDEALHASGLHPNRRSDTLSAAESGLLWRSIRRTLRKGIRRNGASIDWVYRGGDFQNQLRVYRRTGLPCPVCGSPVKRLLVGQRGTHVCPHCQPLGPHCQPLGPRCQPLGPRCQPPGSRCGS